MNSMYLLQQLLESRFVAPNIVRRTIARRRFGALVRNTALECRGWSYLSLLGDVGVLPGVSC
jgi:hypothetical protein